MCLILLFFNLNTFRFGSLNGVWILRNSLFFSSLSLTPPKKGELIIANSEKEINCCHENVYTSPNAEHFSCSQFTCLFFYFSFWCEWLDQEQLVFKLSEFLRSRLLRLQSFLIKGWKLLLLLWLLECLHIPERRAEEPFQCCKWNFLLTLFPVSVSDLIGFLLVLAHTHTNIIPVSRPVIFSPCPKLATHLTRRAWDV